ncbi:alpha/beta fold hydrolase [Pendulispora brunnea]|uniref:Alpha/beta fold hydrolase n=1 Tax=Pendulispora brunnea TaxID=2905690 RepID=A0ABZ2KS54_9BACT
MAVAATRHVNARRAGLKPGTVRVNERQVAYFSGGRGEPVVLLHGLGDDRHSFVESVSELTRHTRVILPDLPGHGDSEGSAEDAGSIRALVQWLAAFLDALALGSVSLGGNSMGGHVALAFALSYGAHVNRLVLVNPAGVGMPMEKIYTGFGAPLGGREDLERVFRRVFYKPHRVPSFIAAHLIKQINSAMPRYNEMARRLRDEPGIGLDHQLASIRVPTLVLWGVHDVVLLPSVREALRRIPDHRVVELPAGHSPQLELPGAVATELIAFLHP